MRTAAAPRLDSRTGPIAVSRGRYKVFLGMAAGVGKTYAMLQEGQAEARAGRDVVIGYVLDEMDLPEIPGRQPELC